MPTARKNSPASVYQLHVRLLHLEPAVWRRLWVPDTLTLAGLQKVLQAVMGWENSHLHEWEIDGQRYGMSLDEYPTDKPAKLERGLRLAEVLPVAGKSFTYTYDFGDNWQHVVTVEKLLKPDPELNTWPQCLAGENACPPEDVGGTGGYMDFLEAMSDPEHEEHKAMRKWFGGVFDPRAFDVNAVNVRLRGLGPDGHPNSPTCGHLNSPTLATAR